MKQVDTRNGIFANEGYGGGVFNLNVGFGAADETRSGGLGATGLGQFLVDFPQKCWDNPLFRDCYYQYVGYAQSDCSDPDVLDTYVDRDECVAAIAQNDVWSHCVNAYCAGSGGSIPQSTAPYEPYPWNAYSQQTKDMQADINRVLAEQGCELIDEDGVLGPITCGAARFVDPSIVPTVCKKFTDPTCGDEEPPPACASGYFWNGAACEPVPPREEPCPAGQVRQPDGSCLPPTHPKASTGPTKAWMMIGGLLLAAAAAGAYAISKKKQK